MPEIAEVRLVTDNVRDFLKGNILTEIKIVTENYRQARKLTGVEKILPQLVVDVKTKGKFSYLLLENGDAIGYGLGMSGNIRVEPTPEYLALYNKNMGKNVTAKEYLKHAHLKIKYQDVTDGSIKHFYYHDIRRFGTWEYLQPADLQKKLKTIGSDLIDEELTREQAVNLMRKYNNKNICAALMGQKMLGGVGNYMKAEILYDCKIWPFAKICDLSDDELHNIYLASRDIAYRAYTYGGAALYTYTGMNGDQSDFKTQLRIYNRRNDPKGNPVEIINDKMSPDKRTTHWVPAVQTVGQTGESMAARRPKLKIIMGTKPKPKVKLTIKPKLGR